MEDIIRYFFDGVIKNFAEVYEDFYKDPKNLADYVLRTREITDNLAKLAVQLALQDMDDKIYNLPARKKNWYVERKGVGKGLITSLGKITIQKTLYVSKNEVDENGKSLHSYLLDKVLGLEPNQEITEDVMRNVYQEAVQTSYRKGGELASADGGVSKGTVKNILHATKFPENYQKQKTKRVVEYLYIDADEDHYHLQFNQKKGDLKISENGRKLNGAITKLIYVFEGIRPVSPKSDRHELIHPHYFCRGNDQDNKNLWKEVFDYIETTYDMEQIKRIYVSSDGGSWIKEGYRGLCATTFVLDGFHLSKSVGKMTGHMKDSKEDAKKELYRAIRSQTKKEFESIVERLKDCTDKPKTIEKIEKEANYILSNWTAAKYRLQKKEGVVSCTAEGHVYHLLSSRMSTQAMGWSKHGANQMARLREYYYNGGNMMELAKYQRKPLKLAAGAEEVVLSAYDELKSERLERTKLEAEYGKYSETMRVVLPIQKKKQLMFQLNGKI